MVNILYFFCSDLVEMWTDCLLILFISVCTAFLGEGLTWLLVYRTEKYQKLKLEVEKQSKRRKNAKFAIRRAGLFWFSFLQLRRERKSTVTQVTVSKRRKSSGRKNA